MQSDSGMISECILGTSTMQCLTLQPKSFARESMYNGTAMRKDEQITQSSVERASEGDIRALSEAERFPSRLLCNGVVLTPGLASRNTVMSRCFGTYISKGVIALQEGLCDLTGRISELLVQLKSFFFILA